MPDSSRARFFELKARLNAIVEAFGHLKSDFYQVRFQADDMQPKNLVEGQSVFIDVSEDV